MAGFIRHKLASRVANVNRPLKRERKMGVKKSADGYPAVGQLALALIQHSRDCLGQSTNLRCAEALHIVKQYAPVLLSFGYAEIDPPRERSAIFRDKRP